MAQGRVQEGHFTEYGVGVISVLPAVDVARDIFKEKSAT